MLDCCSIFSCIKEPIRRGKTCYMDSSCGCRSFTFSLFLISHYMKSFTRNVKAPSNPLLFVDRMWNASYILFARHVQSCKNFICRGNQISSPLCVYLCLCAPCLCLCIGEDLNGRQSSVFNLVCLYSHKGNLHSQHSYFIYINWPSVYER